MARRVWNGNRFGRLLGFALGLATATLAMMLIHPWVAVFLRSPRVHRAAIGLLVALKVTYGLVLVGALVGTTCLAGILWRAWRRRTRRPMVARWLLMCAACLIALAFAEAIAFTGRVSHRFVPSPSPTDPALPTRFIEPNDAAVVNLVVLGESSAAGVPYESWLSVGRIVTWKLGEVIPNRQFRALVLATPGDTLEYQYRRLAELRQRPDAVIVYCGHNEFSSRIPWSRRVCHYVDERPPFLDQVNEMADRFSPVCALIRRVTDTWRIRLTPGAAPQPPLVDAPAFTPTEFAANFADFRRRLEAITAYTVRIGALPVLVVPPANDAGFEPLRSFLPADTPRAARDAFARDFQAAHRLESSDREQSIAQYRALLARQPRFAESHYRLARLLETTGAWDEAYQHYIAARDLDGLPMRCVTQFQQVYRDVAAAHHCVLVDGQALFHAIGPHGLLDDSLFNDIMHPSLRGHIAIAQAILQSLCARRSFGWPRDVPAPAIDAARCVAQFGMHSSDWKSVCQWGELFYSAAARLRNDPKQCRAKEQAYQDAVQRIGAGERAESLGLPNVGIPVALPAPTAPRAALDFHKVSASPPV